MNKKGKKSNCWNGDPLSFLPAKTDKCSTRYTESRNVKGGRKAEIIRYTHKTSGFKTSGFEDLTFCKPDIL